MLCLALVFIFLDYWLTGCYNKYCLIIGFAETEAKEKPMVSINLRLRKHRAELVEVKRGTSSKNIPLVEWAVVVHRIETNI